MTRYSVQPRDRIFVKGYAFLSYPKNMGKNIGKNTGKNLSGKYSQKLLDHAKKLQQMHLKLLKKEQFKKQQKQLVIWLVIKLLIKSRGFQKGRNKLIQKQLQMSMIKKYQKKDIYLQKKDKKLLMI